MKVIDYLRRRLKPRAPRIPEHELYPICLTCRSIMEHQRDCPPGLNTPTDLYYCPTCKVLKGPAEVWGDDAIATAIRSQAKRLHIKPLEVNRP